MKEYEFVVRLRVTQDVEKGHDSFEGLSKDDALKMLKEIFFGVPMDADSKEEYNKILMKQGEPAEENPQAKIIDWGEHISFADTKAPINTFLDIKVDSVVPASDQTKTTRVTINQVNTGNGIILEPVIDGKTHPDTSFAVNPVYFPDSEYNLTSPGYVGSEWDLTLERVKKD